MRLHLVLGHPTHDLAIREKKRRQQRIERFVVNVDSQPVVKRHGSDDQIASEKQPVKRQKTWWKMQVTEDQIKGHIARWLIRDGLPYNMVNTPAFRDLLVGITGNQNITIPSNKTFNDILDKHYEDYEKDTSKLLVEEFKEFHETPYLTVEHDLCTTNSKNCVVGASCGFIDRQWKPRKIALLAQVKNDGHDSEEVATLLDEQLKHRFGLDVAKMARFTISDTAAAARKVSRQFDTTLQTDCAMHALNFCIAYGIGYKENVRNVYKEDPKTGTYIKQKTVVTEGGAFPEGGTLIRKLRALNNFSASSRSPERIERLKAVQKFYKLPQLAALVDIDVRVASSIKHFRRSIINYPAFQSFFQNIDVSKSEKEDVFSCITDGEWELAVQMEAVMQRIAELALIESQSATMLSSTMYVLLRVAAARMNSYKFSAYCLKGPRDEITNENNFDRVQMKLSDLSELSHRCIKRTLHQIAERLPRPSVEMGMALLLDPRTKRSAKNFLRIPDTAEAVTDTILEETKEQLRIEHRVFYKAIHASEEQGRNVTAASVTSLSNEGNSTSDTEADLVYGEEVSQPFEENPADTTMNEKADTLLEEWLDTRIDWEEVARHQYPKKEEYEKVVAKLSVRNKRKGNVRVWNVEQLCQHIDVCRWFAEYGQTKYPSIAKLARVWLGRGCSTAFQERVFSTASFVMSPLRTRTDNERAQRQLILRHNRLELHRMEESKHGIW